MSPDQDTFLVAFGLLALAGSITNLVNQFAEEKSLNSEQTTMVLSFVNWMLLAVCVMQSTPTPPPEPEPPPPSTNAPTVTSTTLMPIEVLGTGGTVKSISLVTTNGHLADSITLTMFNLQYEGMAAVAINGTNWVELTESTVGYTRVMDAAQWGIGGIHGTLHIVMPVTNWTIYNGTNTFSFKFDDRNGLLIGFRVLALNLQHAGTNLMSESQFIQDDPAAWVGPSTNLVDILDGQDAWFNLRIREQGTNLTWIDPYSGATNNVTCSDCHDRNGRDLTYFNYSNESIIKRSLFHDVPAPRATNIASYIRWLRDAYPVPYQAKGRPWNPPYQPGPGMSSVPVNDWAAGAGLEWVMTNDMETFQHLFPGGATTNSITSYTNTLDAREMPLAVQFPVWNMWLPRVHPLSAWGSYYGQTNGNYFQIYRNATNALNTRSGIAAASYFNGIKGKWDSYSTTGGNPVPAISDPGYFAFWTNKVGTKHFRLIKTWEIMTEHQIEDMGIALFGALSDNRRWFHGDVFNLAPHKMGGLPTWEAWLAQSMQWYQLQLVLNSGNRRNGAIVPIDWGYQSAINKSSWANPTNEITYCVMLLNCIKGIEVTVNDFPMDSPNGWSPFKGEPNNLAALVRPFDYLKIPEATRAAAANAIIQPWINECELYTRAEYEAAGKLVGNTGLGNRTYGMLENFIEIGCDTNMTAQIYRFGTNIWPEIDWSALAP